MGSNETGLHTRAYGLKLARAREALGLSQTEAGRLLGKVRETISLIERGQFNYAPSPREMQDYDKLYVLPPVEQLSTLGYPVNLPQWQELGELSSLEVRLVDIFRRLEPSLRHRSLRLLQALLLEPGDL